MSNIPYHINHSYYSKYFYNEYSHNYFNMFKLQMYRKCCIDMKDMQYFLRYICKYYILKPQDKLNIYL